MGLPDLRNAIVAALGEERARQRHETAAPAEGGGPAELQGDDIDDPDSEDVPAYDETKPLRIAVTGRPNAGKSTLINTMLGEERLLTGPEAGITRDSISVDWHWRGRQIKLFDTAGLRRRSRVQEKLEKLSVADALRAIRFAEVVVIVLDATIPFEKQDLHIADLVIREGRAPVIAFNKWDRVEDRQHVLRELREKTDRLLPQVRGIRAVPISGETGEGLDKLMQAIVETHKVWNRRVPTARLNKWLERAAGQHPPPAVSGRRLKIKYATQVKTRPPGFVVNCSRPEAMPESYVRYLANGLRETFDMPGVPIRIVLRSSDNPFAKKAR
jgi:GTP-binding protein